jgi:hypothetical protein
MENASGNVLYSRAVDHVAIAIGTSEGLFMVSDGHLDGPFFAGERVPSILSDGDRYLAATVSPHWGCSLHSTDDAGVSWTEHDPRSIAFPAGSGAAVVELTLLHEEVPGAGVMYAGAEPAALFRSMDRGRTFDLVRSLWERPERSRWAACGGGPALNSVLTHPARPGRVVVGISGGGVYRSDDGGESWIPRNVGLPAPFLPDPYPEHGQCVHRVSMDAGDPDVLWVQNHQGLYRSQNAGDTWVDAGHHDEEAGLPTPFGYTVVAHPRWPGAAYVFPLESDTFPCSAGGHCRIYRTLDSGKTWEGLDHGLPGGSAHVTVFRDALTVGSGDPYVIAFGTSAGEVYASVDGGESWRIVARHLPSVLTTRILD